MAYPISKKYALSAGQGDKRRAQPDVITAHEVGNPNNTGADSAEREASYMKRNSHKAYTHYIVGDKAIYQVGEPGYIAWGAGNVNGISPVQIELARVDSKARFVESYKRYIWLIRASAKKYNIPLTLDTGSKRGVKSHYWVSMNLGGTDHVDPYGYLKKWGISKAQFAKDIKNGVGDSGTVANPKPKVKAYYTWNPIYIHALKTIKAYKNANGVGSGKNVVQSYAKNAKLKVKQIVGKTFELNNGLFVTANKEYVTNTYFTVDGGVKQVVSINGTNRYRDVELTQKVDSFKKGTKFDVSKVVPSKTKGVTRIKLGNGLYISANKLINGFSK